LREKGRCEREREREVFGFQRTHTEKKWRERERERICVIGDSTGRRKLLEVETKIKNVNVMHHRHK
jgi:hypothetical protein